MKTYRVTVEQLIKIGNRLSAQPVQRAFTVNAKTAKGAEKAIHGACISGRIISVEMV